MAAFTDQFSRQSPFDLPLRSEFFSWPNQIAQEAIALVSSRDIEWLTNVGRQLERAISISTIVAVPKDSPDAGNKQFVASTFREKTNIPLSVFRDLYGDFNLLMQVHDLNDWDLSEVKSSKADRLLVFCLWKLVDASIIFQNRAPRNAASTLERGGAYTIEAMRALQAAQSILHEKRLVSDRNRKNGVRANPNAETNRLRALEMAEEFPFRSNTEAAEYIASNLVKEVNKAGKETFYSIDWIKDRLREAGWVPQHKRKAPK
ncbi:hypothetical protein [Rhodoferax sp. GW822-FHT02A01]|uniref:hypothetical protein n=1 Tax=Rhodoferax sp. GW822-FHT02A01 TaxID=3141537 RepID=UPI00315CFEF2